MKKILLLTVSCILFVEGLNAQQQVSVKEARTVAINTLRNKIGILKVSPDLNIKKVNNCSNMKGNVLMYEVEFQNGAAVLLSGSKACLPVLGYYTKNDEGSIFDANNEEIPPGLKALLKDYADEIEYCFAQDNIPLSYKEKWQELQKSSLSKSSAPPFIHVEPLLTTKWGQQWANSGECPGYNYYVTKTNSNQCGDENCGNLCPVGCTAVAMGQVMKYWNYPVYQPGKTQQYDWCNMPDSLWSYNKPNSTYIKERNAVARLLKDCADAANAFYCIAQCNTSALLLDARRGLVNDFGYSSDAVFRLRSSHPINHSNVWIDYLRTNLNAGRPVIYGSLGLGDAHYWVCDGYGDNGSSSSSPDDYYFHFNFGWRGSRDDWYTLNGLSSVGYYNISQEALFDIYPSGNQDHCNFTWPLAFHYNYWDLQNIPVATTHLWIPRTFTTLESVPEVFPSAWRTIEPGQSAEYVAHHEIHLLPGFDAKPGSAFSAKIESCADCNSARVAITRIENGMEVVEEIFIAVENEQEEQPLEKAQIPADEPQVYPNPTTGLLTIQAKNNLSQINKIELYNTQGTHVFNFTGNQSFFQEIDISNLPPQLYILNIQMNGHIFTKKVILQK